MFPQTNAQSFAATYRLGNSKRPRLHHLVIEALTEEIVRGSFPPGTALPTEPELAARFDVSRTVIREAVRILASKGLVVAKQGSGVWVQPPDTWDHLDPLILANRLQVGQDVTVLDHLLEVRQMLEVEVAGLAAERRTEDDLHVLRDMVMRMREAVGAGRIDELSTLDPCFHQALFSASGNIVMRQMAWVAITLIQSAGTLQPGRRPKYGLPPSEVSQRGHEAILAAVESGDPERARGEMLRHCNEAEVDIRSALIARREACLKPGAAAEAS